MSDEPPKLDRAFAQLVADAMQPHLKRAMDDAVSEYMGPNGEQHRVDHKVVLPEISAFLKERDEEKKASVAMYRQIRTGVMIGIVMLVVNLVGGLVIYWVTTVNRAQIAEIRREIPAANPEKR